MTTAWATLSSVVLYTTSGRQQYGSDVLASDHTPPLPPTPPLSLFAPVPKYSGHSAPIDVFDAFHHLMYTGGVPPAWSTLRD